MDELAKNLWLLLTLVLPGMTTYGSFRLLVALDAIRIDKALFDKLDGSALLTACALTALALGQQAIAMVVEAGLAAACSACKRRTGKYYILFCERFKMAARGDLNESATRIIGSFFLSLNVTIGQGVVLCYLVLHERLSAADGAVRVIAVFAAVALISTVFRLINAASIVDEAGAHSLTGAVSPGH